MCKKLAYIRTATSSTGGYIVGIGTTVLFGYTVHDIEEWLIIISMDIVIIISTLKLIGVEKW